MATSNQQKLNNQNELLASIQENIARVGYAEMDERTVSEAISGKPQPATTIREQLNQFCQQYGLTWHPTSSGAQGVGGAAAGGMMGAVRFERKGENEGAGQQRNEPVGSKQQY